MTAKEKKDQLISDFLFAQRKYNGCADVGVARDCARKCVTEITSALENYGRDTDELQNMEQEMRFWDKIYEEI
jgi:hypothetical protein